MNAEETCATGGALGRHPELRASYSGKVGAMIYASPCARIDVAQPVAEQHLHRQRAGSEDSGIHSPVCPK